MEIEQNNNSNVQPQTFILDKERQKNYAEMFKSMDIQCRPFSNADKKNTLGLKIYPKKWNYPCYSCLDKFDTIPIIRIHKWNYDLNVPIFNLAFVFCSKSCYSEFLETTSSNKQSVELENFSKFREQYLQDFSRDICFIPKFTRKDLNPLGIYTKEEWQQKKENVYAFIEFPPFYVVDTFILENDRSGYMDADISTKYKVDIQVTQERQKKFDRLVDSVMNKAN